MERGDFSTVEGIVKHRVVSLLDTDTFIERGLPIMSIAVLEKAY